MSAHDSLGLGVRTPVTLRCFFRSLEIAGWLCAPNDNSLPGFFHDVFETSRQIFFGLQAWPEPKPQSKSIQLDVHEPGAPQLHGSFQWLIISLVSGKFFQPTSLRAYPPKRIISPPRSSNFRAGGGTFAAPFSVSKIVNRRLLQLSQNIVVFCHVVYGESMWVLSHGWNHTNWYLISKHYSIALIETLRIPSVFFGVLNHVHFWPGSHWAMLLDFILVHFGVICLKLRRIGRQSIF